MVLLTAEKVPFVPLPTVTLVVEKPVTASEKVKVNVVAPVAVPATLSEMVTDGARVSKAWMY